MIDKVDFVVSKGEQEDTEAYSAFVDVWGIHPSELDDKLRDAGIKTVFVVGLGMVLAGCEVIVAEDYCVKWTSLDAKKRGYETFVVGDCTRGVAPETTLQAIREFEQQGVKFITSSRVKELIK
jgi:nicotinamidase-related amidase